MRAIPSMLVVVLFLPSTDLSGQVSAYVQPGDRLRVTAPTLGVHRQVTRFVRQLGDTLTVQADSVLMLPLISVTQLEVGRGRSRTPVIFGALLGAVLGGVAGSAIGPKDCGSGSFEGAGSCVMEAILVFVGGVAIGGSAGSLVGMAVAPNRWSQVSRVGVARQPDRRVGVGLSVAF